MSYLYILHKSGAEIKEEITVKQITLEQVRKGERFVLDGVAFVKLDEDRESSFVVSEDVVLKGIAFDTQEREDRNNYMCSGIQEGLDEWASEHEEIYEAALERPIDLLSMDGMTDYGKPEVSVRMLTVDEYRKYRALIPLTDEAYWLATPWTTLRSPHSDSDFAYYVYTSGALNYSNVYNPYFAARPAFYLQSSISVSVDGDEKCSLETYDMTELLQEIARRVGEK